MNLVRADLERAIYLDFEGFPHQLPVIAGIACEEVWTSDVFDERVVGLRDPRHSVFPAQVHPVEYIQSLFAWAVDEHRLIACYSEHELRVARTIDPTTPFASVYFNVRAYAKQWANRNGFGPAFDEWSLEAFLHFIGYEWPAGLEIYPTTCLRIVLDGVDRRGSINGLTADEHKAWNDLLLYNQHDCFGARELALHVFDHWGRTD